ncbi:restriction endonuclease subunit S [Acinetobacter seifertii]|uniref:restriction endonuclease subunit S n=1 Tax=Acinetobacter seifertii TaxID=1530123 RepID=UPI0038625800
MSWEDKKLSEMGVNFQSGFAFKSVDFKKSGIPVIKIGNIQNKLVSIDTNGNYIGLDTLTDKIKDYLLNNDDVLIAMTGQGSVGRVGRLKLKLGEKALLNQRVGRFICNEVTVHLPYIYYVLTSDLYQEYLFNTGVGSGQPNLSPQLILETEIPCPSYEQQKAIASVLSSLDDKIDLLHRQNKTLEAMAEALFHQWFIEEAKEDWEIGTLEDLIDLKYGKALKQENRSGSGYPVVASSGVVGFHNKYLVEGPGIVIGRKGTLGKVYFLEDSFFPIDTSYFIKTKIPESNLIFEYYLLKTLDFANMNSDSAVPGLNRNLALGTTIQIPPLKRIVEFNTLAKPWFSKIYTNTKQIQTLEKLRDTLLPNLMSGEVRVEYERVDAA